MPKHIDWMRLSDVDIESSKLIVVRRLRVSSFEQEIIDFIARSGGLSALDQTPESPPSKPLSEDSDQP